MKAAMIRTWARSASVSRALASPPPTAPQAQVWCELLPCLKPKTRKSSVKLMCVVFAGGASASKTEEVKRLPGGKLKKKVGSLCTLYTVQFLAV